MREHAYALAVCSALALSCTTDLASSSQPVTGTATVTAEPGLRLRSGPSTNYSILTVMPEGSTVEVLGGPEKSFYELRYADASETLEGWGHGDYLDLQLDPVGAGGPDGGVGSNLQKARVKSAWGGYMRSGPASGYRVLANLPTDTLVDLLGDHRSSYYEVLHHAPEGSIAGWIHEYALELPTLDQSRPSRDAFGYPVGDLTTAPAGGWVVWQVLGHYNSYYGGRHQAQDIASAQGGIATIDAPVYSVADGVVRYAGSNGSSYQNTVLIEHPLADGTAICSFYGHINPPQVSTGDSVERGDQIATVMDWNRAAGGASTNTHLHYVFLSKELCDVSAAADGALVCGYDKGGASSVETLDDEPSTYTSHNDACNDWMYPDAFLSPSQFIESHKTD